MCGRGGKCRIPEQESKGENKQEKHTEKGNGGCALSAWELNNHGVYRYCPE